MSRSDPQFNLRIREDLKTRIEAAARSSGRSVTAEIIYRLEASFADPAKVVFAEEDRLIDMSFPTGDNSEWAALVRNLWRAHLKTEATMREMRKTFPGLGRVKFRSPEQARRLKVAAEKKAAHDKVPAKPRKKGGDPGA